MSISFSGSELIDIAINIEHSGIAFYDIMTRSAENEVARIAFKYLADMERQHVETFRDMLGEADKYQLAGTRDEDYAGYVKSLVDSAVFSEDALNSELADKVSNDIDAVELAMGAEKDSILFYYEVRELMHQHDQSAVTRIIAEEKTHLRQLSMLKKKLSEVKR